jgi:hypothetical protein
MIYEYLINTLKIWIKVLYYIDEDMKNDKYMKDKKPYTKFSVYIYEKELFNKLNKTDIQNMYPMIDKEEYIDLLIILHNIFLIIEKYIQEGSSLYAFFRLSNIVKINKDINIDFYFDYFKINNIKPVENDTRPINFQIKILNITDYMRKFYTSKVSMFESDFKDFIDELNGVKLSTTHQ